MTWLLALPFCPEMSGELGNGVVGEGALCCSCTAMAQLWPRGSGSAWHRAAQRTNESNRGRQWNGQAASGGARAESSRYPTPSQDFGGAQLVATQVPPCGLPHDCEL